MSLNDFIRELDNLVDSAVERFNDAVDKFDGEVLEAARVEFLGAKSGKLKSAQKGLGKVSKDDKPVAGKRFNEVKQRIEELFESAVAKLSESGGDGKSSEAFDVSLPGTLLPVGHVHPITQTIEELKDIMGRLGFSAVEGPEIEDDWHNFEALNIPLEHPARDPLDNFYLNAAAKAAGGDMLLRSQTSTVQIRVMENTKPPVRIVSLGRVYRPDEIDATHYAMFHQIEGLMIDTDVTMADLKSVLHLFAKTYLGQDVEIRFRPSFFPFTEPSVEVDMRWNDTWLEFGGAGMVDPNVLRSVGYDPEEVTGFAFGLGVERLCMRRHGVNDIRHLYNNNVRFLSQF
ncbi:phenylalanine--tRNA ligase subunit alpha [Blastopirellula retiformator]|uniref:Phenylalanine--tRNA ligase alpha subunit n=1 Tax=Blastopirellula retiformator TaxID=2527970 RepID=A0A5C5V5L7_9BACT|nr:phenylalanine--tRNA ligase subunit alpha [Blastopirellula retiformator]TWT33035.1 Phenylalanine--tRNA ligase alpha subunit [Blastopirellula retiformator]